ncbi:predicted histidine kinase [gamma proteobacterium HdN1]|nr:predicted histidine kinase [gamma proteobacterium HdN1]
MIPSLRVLPHRFAKPLFRNRFVANLILSSLFLALFASFHATTSSTAYAAPQASEQSLRIALTFNFFRYITWPNEQSLPVFRIGVLTNDARFFEEIQRSAPLLQIRNKGFQVVRVTSTQNLASQGLQMLYLDTQNSAQLDAIAPLLRGRGTLLVSNGSSDARSVMINLVRTPENTLRFEINRSNLIYEKLSVDRKIILLGGTELDVAKLFRQTEDTLQKTKMQLAEQEQKYGELLTEIAKTRRELSTTHSQVEQQKSLLQTQTKQLLQQQTQITGQEKQLDDQGKQLVAQQAKFTEVNATIARSEHELQRKIEELQQQAERLKSAEARLAETKQELASSAEALAESRQQFVINQQQVEQSIATIEALRVEINNAKSELKSQLAELGRQTIVIDYLRYWLIAIAFASLAMLGLAFALFRSNRARKRNAEELQAANQALLAIHTQLANEKQEAERKNEAKSRFLANVSHEIRTPMNVVLGYSDLLQQTPGLGSDSRRALQVINRSGEHLLTLINDILDVSRIEAGTIQLVEQDFCLQTLLMDLEVMFSERCQHQNTQLSIKAEPDTHPDLRGDRGKLLQILINLVGNAVKFTEQGQILLTVNTQPMGADQFELNIIVKDTGCGIAPEDYDKVFSLYQQTESGQRLGKGTGLGLAISREFARRMGGDLVFESEIEKGTTFYLRIPFRAGQQVASEIGAAPHPVALEAGQTQRRILIVDDNENNRELLHKILLPFDFCLNEASNGQSAVQICQDWHPDLILMDIRMPEMDGHQAIREIRKIHSRDQLPIIVLTAGTLAGDVEKSTQEGANDYLSKPFKADDVLSRIGKQLNLRYIYANHPWRGSRHVPPDDKASLRNAFAQLPESLQQLLRKDIELGHATGLLQHLETVDHAAPELVAALRALAQDFDYPQLLEITAPHQSTPTQ